MKDKSGYYVSPATPFSVTDQADDPAVSAWLHWDSLARVQSLEAEYQFSKSLIDPSLLPNRYWGELMRDLLDQYPRLLGTYSTIQGDLELRSALASHLTKKNASISLQTKCSLHRGPSKRLMSSRGRWSNPGIGC